jgi:hypothetical protein
MNLIYSKTNFFLNVKKKKCVNSASELHCLREQCNSRLNGVCYTVHAN